MDPENKGIKNTSVFLKISSIQEKLPKLIYLFEKCFIRKLSNIELNVHVF